MLAVHHPKCHNNTFRHSAQHCIIISPLICGQIGWLCHPFQPEISSTVQQDGEAGSLLRVTTLNFFTKHETEHPIDWDSARVIERDKHVACRKIKGSLHIKRSVNCINTDPGCHMYPVWFTTLHSMPR